MTIGTAALATAYAKLRWAVSRHDEMLRIFAAFALPADPDDRPYGITFSVCPKPAGLVVATFIVEEEMPEAMTMLAADVVHNTRVALDHTLARLKEHLGGNAGRGSFPICSTTPDWLKRVSAASRNPLHGLDTPAVNLIYDEQPMHRADPEHDPLDESFHGSVRRSRP